MWIYSNISIKALIFLIRHNIPQKRPFFNLKFLHVLHTHCDLYLPLVLGSGWQQFTFCGQFPSVSFSDTFYSAYTPLFSLHPLLVCRLTTIINFYQNKKKRKIQIFLNIYFTQFLQFCFNILFLFFLSLPFFSEVSIEVLNTKLSLRGKKYIFNVLWVQHLHWQWWEPPSKQTSQPTNLPNQSTKQPMERQCFRATLERTTPKKGMISKCRLFCGFSC